MNKKTFLLLFAIILISLFFNLYNNGFVPPCLNADEAANGYNAYSILKTGKDEYGNTLPLRFKSFGDYKLPIYTYLSVPFIAIFGLNDFSVRLANTFIVFLFPIVIFFLTKELFEKSAIGVLAAFLVGIAPGLHILSRQAHEGYVSAFLVAASAMFFLRVMRKTTTTNVVGFLLSVLLSLFAYHSSRLFALYFFCWLGILFLKRKKTFFVPFLGFLLVLTLFFYTDIVYKPERINNLLFFRNIGFTLKIDELRAEGGPRLLYNKLLVGLKNLSFEYMNYFSPRFLVIQGDENIRFGFRDLSPITLVEYIFIFIGIYYLFKRQEKRRFFLLGLFLISPLSASLAWASGSLTRSLFILIPALLIAGYGIYHFITSFKKRTQAVILLVIAGLYLFFLFYSWDFYLNHYPKRATTIRSWQCGYKELVDYVKENYAKHSKFYITRKNGQPYIFFLFYFPFEPDYYQKHARLTPPDEYGFGQVEEFDKFVFEFREPKEKDAVLIGYPDDFAGMPKEYLKESKIKKIKVGTEEMFWIYKP